MSPDRTLNVGVGLESKDPLDASQTRYRQLFASYPHPMWVYDVETLAFLAVNDAAIQQYGFRRDEFMAMTLRDIRPAEELPPLLRRINEGTSSGIVNERGWRHRKKDGSIIEVEISRQHLFFEGRRAGLVSVRDVTALVQSERRRRAEHGVARTLAEAARLSDALPSLLESLGGELRWDIAQAWLVDDDGTSMRLAGSWQSPEMPDSALVQASRKMSLTVGEGLPGLTWRSHQAANVAEPFEGPMPRASAARADGLVSGLAFPIMWKDSVLGAIELLDRRPQPADPELNDTLQNVGQQIGQFAARRRAEEELLAARSRLDQMVTVSGSVIYSLRARGAEVVPEWITDNILEVTGFPATEINHEFWKTHIHPDDLESAFSTLGRAVRDGRGVQEYRVRHRDGEYRWIRDELRMAGAKDGYVRLAGSLVDVTERKRLEAQLFQVQRLESLGQLAGGVAHDFNNILAAILGCAEMALMEQDANSSARADLLEIRDAAERGAGLTQQLLAFSRTQASKPEALIANDMIRELDKMLRRLIPRAIDIQYALDADVPWIFADPGQVQQVIMNLVINARDALPNKGLITISTKRMPAGVQSNGADGVLLLAVSDNGSGMSAETRERLFEPFFTTKAPGKGTGLGLATVHGIVSRAHGQIDVESELGKGTTFAIRWPACAAPQARAMSA